MSYRNPQIITDKSGEITAQGLSAFSQSIAGGLQQWSANIDQRKKAEIAKKERQNKIKTDAELNALKRATDFNSKLAATTLTEEIKPIVRKRLIYAADLRSDLYSESDPEKRQAIMKEISNVETFLSTTATGLNKLNEDVSAYSELSPTELNAQYGVAGDKNAQINNQGFLTGLAGQADEANFKPYFDEKTNSIVVRAKGRTGDANFSMENFSFNSYVNGSDLIFPISQLRKEAADSATKLILDDKGNMKPGLINEKQLQVIDQDVIKNGKVVGKRKVQGQIETVNKDQIIKTINPLVNAEVESLLNSSDQQKEAILSNQYGGLSWEDFAYIENSAEQKEALRAVIEPVVITDVLGNDFKQATINGQPTYYRETEVMKEVVAEKPSKSVKLTKQKAKEYYDVFRKDPAGEWERLIGTPTDYDRENNIITVFSEEAVLDAEGAEVLGEDGFPKMATKPIKYDMNVPLTRNTFYTRLLENSGYAGGGAAGGELLQAFGEVVKEGTRKKLP